MTASKTCAPSPLGEILGGEVNFLVVGWLNKGLMVASGAGVVDGARPGGGRHHRVAVQLGVRLRRYLIG